MVPQKRFYFIRHGETLWNAKRLITGQTDISLSPKGISQAQTAKILLSNAEITHIYTSTLERALQTAHIINETLRKPITHVNGLKERKWGEWEGTTQGQSLSQISSNQLPKNAETSSEFELRITKAVETILCNTKEVPLIVAHAGVFLALAKICGYPSMHSPNCVPFLFSPLCNSSKWSIAPYS